MNSQTSLIARNVRLKEWASMVQECNARPAGMTVGEWCDNHSITKCDYYYRMRAVRKACLEVIPESIAQQAIVPVPMEVMAPDGNPSIPDNSKETSALELEINGVTIRITEETSSALLAKVLGVVAHVK